MRGQPRLLQAAAILLAIAAGLATAGFTFDSLGVTGFRMDDAIGWVCLFAAIAAVLAIVSRWRVRGSASAGERRLAWAIGAGAAAPLLVVAAILAVLLAL